MKPIFHLVLAALMAANTTAPLLAQTPAQDSTAYQRAIMEAMSPGPDKVYPQLIALDNTNPNLIRKTIDGVEYLLMVSWKGSSSYYKPNNGPFYNTQQYEIWVTAAPELLKRMRAEKYCDANVRLKQLLGLPPTSTYNYFIEFWVKQADIFRPCPDNDPTDSQCDLCFPAGADSAYQQWVNGNRISRYYPCGLYSKYPWTQLGYTYDWNPWNASHVGLSEFVIKPNSNVIINKIYTTEEYLSSGTTAP